MDPQPPQDATSLDATRVSVVAPPPAAAVSRGVSVPGYDILGVLGKGGMGVVYRARQASLKRAVALKMTLEGEETDETTISRFRREAEAVAQLHHENIVQIYEVGEHEKRPYFSMELVYGGSLARKLVAGALPVTAVAQIVEKLARAMQHAHQQGVIHRDLKPSNILLTNDGEPKITDFGLAKRLTTETATWPANTQTGEVLGTPWYMSPEQAAGHTRTTGPATDIYALGVILYEMLCGTPPFLGDEPMEVLRRVISEEPVPPARLQPSVPVDLQTICLTCLNKDPFKRYATAGALAEDLQAFLDGRPIKARPPGMTQRLGHWARRRPTHAVSAAVAAVACIALVVGLFYYNIFTVIGVAVLSLLLAAGWYNRRLHHALAESREQHLLAERHVERLHILLDTTRRLMTVTDLNDLLLLLSQTTARMTDAERATIYLVDEAKGEIWSKIALGDSMDEIRVPLGKGIAGLVAQTGLAINISDAANDKRFNPEVDLKTGYKTRNLITLPLKAQSGRILGVFQVLNKRVGHFGAADHAILNMLAASTALALEKILRGQGTRADISDSYFSVS